MKFILASKSSARLKVLQDAGLKPEVCEADFSEEILKKVFNFDAHKDEGQKAAAFVSCLAIAKALAGLRSVLQLPTLATEELAKYSYDFFSRLQTKFKADEDRVHTGLFPVLENIDFLIADFSLSALAENIVLTGCDTMLLHQGRLLGKPADEKEAAQVLSSLSESCGELYTGHCLIYITSEGLKLTCAPLLSKVYFDKLEDEEIRAYLHSGEPLQVAGSFTVDSLGSAFIRGIEGDYHNIVGISVNLLKRLSRSCGISWPQLWS